MDIKEEIKTRKKASFDYLQDKRTLWDNLEQLFHGQLNDRQSEKTKSRVFDHRLSKLLQDRSYRVMANLPVGKVKGISKDDIGGTVITNLLLEKYVIPNANSQWDFLTKLRMVNMYSGLYGSFPVLIDHVVKKNGYSGPDMWLLNIRDVFPQVGAVSPNDSEYMIVRTWQPLSFFERIAKQEGYINVGKIIDKLKDRSGSKQSRDSDNISKREEAEYSTSLEANKKGFYEVLSQYEGDRWVDYCVDADLVFRDGENPHEDEELPVIFKNSTPLLDDFYGISDAERASSMQKVVNSAWNLYLDSVKITTIPPILINKDGVANNASFKMVPGAVWLGRGSINNIAQPINVSPKGADTFATTLQTANAAMLSTFGVSDTTVSKEIDPTQGKTPQALKMQKAREEAGDAADRFHMEIFIQAVMKKMCNLMNKKQSSQIAVRMFKEEIQDISRSYPEILEMYDEETGNLKIAKRDSSVMYDYEIVSGSTFAVDEQEQQDNLTSIINLYLDKGQVLIPELEAAGFKINFGELFKRVFAKSGIKDWDKVLVEKTEEEKVSEDIDKNTQIFQQMLAQMQQGGDVNGIPPEVQGAQMGGMQQ